MKKELIKTENYLLVVDDSDIKIGDWFLTDDKRIEQSAPDWNPREWHKKIIAHLPLNDSPILEGVPLLPPLEEGVFVLPTHFEFEIERKSVLNLGIEPFNPNTHVYTNEPKTTTNSQGQVVACGKYIY